MNGLTVGLPLTARKHKLSAPWFIIMLSAGVIKTTVLMGSGKKGQTEQKLFRSAMLIMNYNCNFLYYELFL